MAWTLFEMVIGALAEMLSSIILKGIWRATMGERCLIKACMRTAGGKHGLCLVCYSRAKKKVDAGETTWEKLEELGLCKGQADPFDDAYTKAMEDK